MIRRKPSRLVHILRLNTETDEIEAGSWFSGRIYEMRSDLSFDGRHMIYLAMGRTGTWTGICCPPFLRTVVDWPNVGAWHGGGLFRSSTRLEINAGYAQEDAFRAINKLGKQPLFEFGLLENPGYGEDEGVLYPRLERDGFRRVGPLGQEKQNRGPSFEIICEEDPGWTYRPSLSHPELRVRYRGFYSDRGRVFEWDLPELPGVLDKYVSWASYDCLGQLIVARLGVVSRYSLPDLLKRSPSVVFDLEPLERPVGLDMPRPARDRGPNRPSIETVKGNLHDLDVRALIIPAHETPWVNELRALAGEFLIQALREWSPELGEVLRTPAYFLRQHDLIHVAEPPPSAGIDRLREVCFAAFDAASIGECYSVALKPIGLDAGWSPEDSLSATMAAALHYLEAGQERRVLIVEP